jgi:hypothetical protein
MVKRNQKRKAGMLPGDLTSKMNAAVHEAGHVVVSAVQGFPVGARI